MALRSKEEARAEIFRLLSAAVGLVQDIKAVNLYTALRS